MAIVRATGIGLTLCSDALINAAQVAYAKVGRRGCEGSLGGREVEALGTDSFSHFGGLAG